MAAERGKVFTAGAAQRIANVVRRVEGTPTDLTGRRRRWPVGIGDDGTISGKVTSNASGNGKYNGKSFTDVTADVSASGNLAESDFGTLSSTEDCLILNPVELGSSTTGHDVTATANTDKFAIYFTGRLVRVNSNGIKVVHAMLFYVGCAEGD
jgi:hypothetical protein